MADVFISYAKADRQLAMQLAARLEGWGWKTWWDTSLLSGDDFGDEIVAQLGKARAVVVIWTERSVKSEWVRSEAGRAHADRKLIPVKSPSLTYRDLPPPFDLLHTEDIGSHTLIRAAIVAQLAKPFDEPSRLWVATGMARAHALTWFGIVGGTITLFANLASVVELARWARRIVSHWEEWARAFWTLCFEFLNIHVPPELIPILNFSLFSLCLALGVRMAAKNDYRTESFYDRALAGEQAMFISYGTISVSWLVSIGLIAVLSANAEWDYNPSNPNFALVFGAGFLTPLLIATLAVSSRKLHALGAMLLFTVFFVILSRSALRDVGENDLPWRALMAYVAYAVMLPAALALAPIKDLLRRLTLLAASLITLLVLNEVSKFDLNLRAAPLDTLTANSKQFLPATACEPAALL